MIKLILLTTLALSTPSNAEPDPWYYYGGPGYYHGYYSPGFKEYPSYYYNNVDPSNLYTFTGPATGADERRVRRAAPGDTTYISLLNPYRDITHYGYPHYYAYGHPIHLNYAGGRNRNKRQIFRNLVEEEIEDPLTDRELNRLLLLLLKSRVEKGNNDSLSEEASEELRRIGYGRGRSRGRSRKTEGQTVGYYYGPYGYYGSPWWAGYGRWGYYAKPGTQPPSYSL